MTMANSMSLETAARIANVRAELADGAVLVTVSSPSRSVAIFPDDIVGKSDGELLAFICRRLDEQSRCESLQNT